MNMPSSLTNQFLIAMPGLQDPNFSRTVTYICEHSNAGTMGIVVNRPLELNLDDVFEQMSITPSPTVRGDTPVFMGGPVNTERGFVLHTDSRSWDSTMQVTDRISVTTSRDILEAMARGEGPDNVLVALGYAGWGSGQLEDEISQNTWLNGPANPDVIFTLPAEQRWQAAAGELGVDLRLMSGDAGHA
ncbi:MAG: YqgE/AlgH family protein [Pseudomonadota bacterium]